MFTFYLEILDFLLFVVTVSESITLTYYILLYGTVLCFHLLASLLHLPHPVLQETVKTLEAKSIIFMYIWVLQVSTAVNMQ